MAYSLLALAGLFSSALSLPTSTNTTDPADVTRYASTNATRYASTALNLPRGGPRVSQRRQTTGASSYCTSSDLTKNLTQIDAPTQGTQPAGDGQTQWSLSIDDSDAGIKQTINGFGAAVTDATVANFAGLASDVLDGLMKTLMTPDGANFGLMRHTIGSSDLSPDPAYTYDDNGGQADTSLGGFNLGDSGEAMAKLLASMKGYNGNMTTLGSPWSAPGWMKLNNALTGDTDNNNLADHFLSSDGPDYSQEYAQYFVKYIQAYEALGANIDAITVQNEPLNSVDGYPTMYVNDTESAILIQNAIGPALKNASLSTSVWAYDHNTDHPEYPQTVIDNAGEFVNTAAWHCYADNVDWTVLTDFHNSNPDVTQYMTECYTPPQDISADSDNWTQAIDFTIGPLQNWASGVIAWTLSSDENAGPHLSSGGCTNCFGLVTTKSDGSYELTMAYYSIAQFSKFMPKGAQVLSGTGSADGVQSVATKNPDGSKSVVILNTKMEELMVNLNVTSGATWSGVVPSNSIVTWVLPSS